MPTKLVNKSGKALTTQIAGANFTVGPGETLEVGDLHTAHEVIAERHVVAKLLGDLQVNGLEVAQPEPAPAPEPDDPEPQP